MLLQVERDAVLLSLVGRPRAALGRRQEAIMTSLGFSS
jgi:hypothetical protein